MFEPASWRILHRRCAQVVASGLKMIVNERLLKVQAMAFGIIPPHHEIVAHQHKSGYDLLVFLDGKAFSDIPLKDQSLGRGHILLFGPQQKHAWCVLDLPCPLFTVEFSLEPPIVISPPANWPVREDLAMAAERLSHELLETNPHEMLAVAVHVMTIISHALSVTTGQERQSMCRTKQKPDLIQAVEQLLLKDLSHPLTREDIARHLGISVRHLTHLFHQAIGETLTSFIMRVRLDHARFLLMESDEKISGICERVGIRNEGYFYRRFHRYCGMTPDAYRRIARQGE